ncbi:hypothetical protein AYI69_g10927 [Smittium culicis]|uniref:Uncharacterized protein n=1 Tax=Smittium culicis TaxID=133412 RepID=A0A1R1X2E5_9FUNG|nr:hypothetical protein AYI69_g10927 [Smittium culicis]
MRTPPIFGADYEENYDFEICVPSNCHDTLTITGSTTKDLAPQYMIENTEKSKAKIEFVPPVPNSTTIINIIFLRKIPKFSMNSFAPVKFSVP